jgi:hypothetical protein
MEERQRRFSLSGSVCPGDGSGGRKEGYHSGMLDSCCDKRTGEIHRDPLSIRNWVGRETRADRMGCGEGRSTAERVGICVPAFRAGAAPDFAVRGGTRAVGPREEEFALVVSCNVLHGQLEQDAPIRAAVKREGRASGLHSRVLPAGCDARAGRNDPEALQGRYMKNL